MRPAAKTGLFLLLIAMGLPCFSQVTSPPKDSTTEFEIIRGPSMRSIYVDSATTLQTIAGGGEVKQGTTLFFADSIVVNPNLHTVEAFRNVHINQADSVQTYGDYLIYYGKNKDAILKNNVRLYDKNAVLSTQDLDYNLGTGIGNYHDGGKVVNGKTTITSTEGTYFSDTKDVYFKQHVVVEQPKNHVTTDSLMYNMETQNYDLVGQTHIRNSEADIFTSSGNYDARADYTLFTSRTKVIDTSGKVYIANNMAIDNKSGNAQMEGNALVRDSAGGYTALADQIFLNKKSNSFLATRKPVLIIRQDHDSIYVAADTLFSGFSTAVTASQFALPQDSVAGDSSVAHHRDSVKKADTVSTPHAAMDSLRAGSRTDSLGRLPRGTARELPGITPTTGAPKDLLSVDSLRRSVKNGSSTPRDTSGRMLSPPVVPHGQDRHDSLAREPVRADTTGGTGEIALVPGHGLPSRHPLQPAPGKDSAAVPRTDTALAKKIPGSGADSVGISPADTTAGTDSVRYFLGFHHVRIYNDSLQAVCDSLFFSGRDSVFRMYDNPVVWNGRSQITGDTMYLYTKNKKAERLYVFDSGFIVNQTPEGLFNQIAGKTVNGYFKDGKIDFMRVRGSQAESIYYAQDADSAYLGMNRATGDVIDLYFDSSALKKVLFVNQINGIFYPMRKIPEDQKYLKSFHWLDSERPKNKLQLFE